ncbi:MAG: LacI family DNA-binding transcriptional regulator [Microbacterium sp.]|nr:LacI family DNA-binding transcriptional regulator [Microbacterium sp.]
MSVSVKEVAEAAGVAVGTVSNVLNHPDKVSTRTRERVQGVIAELGFVRNDAARQLRAGRSRTIGMIVPDVSNPFFAEVARGAQDRASEDDMIVLLTDTEGNEKRQLAQLELFREQRVNGVLLTPASADFPRVRDFMDHGLPVVLVDHPSADDAPAVSVDDVEGGRLAVQHLLDGGRRRIVFVCGPTTVRQVADRLVGARLAVDGCAGATLEVVEQGSLTVAGGAAAAIEISARSAALRPDAIFAANDLLAIGALQVLAKDPTVQVPRDIAVVGYDDIDFASAAAVPLTSVRQPSRRMGWTGVDLLLAGGRRSPDERQVLFRPQLVVRESSGEGLGAPSTS